MLSRGAPPTMHRRLSGLDRRLSRPQVASDLARFPWALGLLRTSSGAVAVVVAAATF